MIILVQVLLVQQVTTQTNLLNIMYKQKKFRVIHSNELPTTGRLKSLKAQMEKADEDVALARLGN